jgi:hypothetical protein
MKYKELIEKIEALPAHNARNRPWIDKKLVLGLVRELDEPQKVTIPQFVADWIEECEEKEKTLLNSLLYTPEGVNSWVGNSDNQELFARAWIEGYEVEKEPKYTVMVKGITGYGRYLNKISKKYCFASENEAYGYTTKHTRKELEEAGFGWVFDCEGIEIEEVE